MEACKKLPDINFHFAGSGPLEKEIEKVGNTKVLGFLEGEELENEIAKAQLVVFPSEWYENCPFTVMESQLCGTPVLGTDLGGTPELLEDGVTGELFESGNVDILSEKLRYLWKNKEQLHVYTENCKKINFDTVEKYVTKLIKLYMN